MSGTEGSDVVVHRCRFIDYQPAAINAIVPHTKRPDGAAIKVALSRATGDIEIWNVNSNWHMERVLPGGADTSVEALVWDSGRLFSAGLHSLITEWDVDKLAIVATADSYGGAVWCLAVSTASDTLAAGCEDGCIKLYDLTGGPGSLEFVRSFDKQDGRVLSLDWHDSDATLVSGGSDGTVRLWTTANGRCKFRVTVQDERKEGTLVWAVKILADGTLVSGDSWGRTQFWDAKFGTLLQSFKQHEADVLVLAVSDDSEVVYASGVDNKVIQIKRVQTESSDSWVVSGRSRDHSHDVRACALTDNGLLVTGGVDTSLIVHHASKFARAGASQRKIPPFPHTELVSLARDGLLLYRHGAALQLWRLGSAASDDAVAAQVENGLPRRVLPIDTQPKLLLELGAKDGHNIVSACLSPDGSLVVYSTLLHTRVFRVQIAEGDGDCSVKRVRGVSGLLGVAHAMAIAADNSLLVVATASQDLQIVDLTGPKLLATIPTGGTRGEASACLLAISPDGQWAAVSYGAEVHIFGLDTLSHHATTAAFLSPPSALAFSPAEPTLVVVCANNQVSTVDAESGLPTEWSRAHSGALPRQWLSRREKVVGISFSPTSPSTAFLHDHSGFTVLDFAKPIPGPKERLIELGTTVTAVERAERRRKEGRGPHRRDGQKDTDRRKDSHKDPRRGDGKTVHLETTDAEVSAAKRSRVDPAAQAASANLKIVKKFQPLLFMGWAPGGTIVAVERPWLAVMQNLPPPLYRAKYGAT
eukprot:m.386918 g.386918  ORF g.386918 m.386918 type:complete len:756 (+) comp16746_c2_seq1:255-2522(+)